MQTLITIYFFYYWYSLSKVLSNLSTNTDLNLKIKLIRLSAVLDLGFRGVMVVAKKNALLYPLAFGGKPFK